jgi:hypothetical protein
MELLPLLRWGWRRRLVLVGALLAAVAAFVGLGGNSRTPGAASAVAWTQVTVETPRSELVAVAPTGADSLSWRASLLVHLMATDASTQALANRVGVTQKELAVVDPSLVAPTIQTSMAMGSALAASAVAAPYSLDVFLADPTLPVISIEAAAPTRSDAERLAAAAVAVLKSQASPGGNFSSAIPTDADPLAETLQPFVIDQVAPLRVMLFPASTVSLKPIAGALLVFLLCCVLGSRLAGRLRPRSRALAT